MSRDSLEFHRCQKAASVEVNTVLSRRIGLYSGVVTASTSERHLLVLHRGKFRSCPSCRRMNVSIIVSWPAVNNRSITQQLVAWRKWIWEPARVRSLSLSLSLSLTRARARAPNASNIFGWLRRIELFDRLQQLATPIAAWTRDESMVQVWKLRISVRHSTPERMYMSVGTTHMRQQNVNYPHANSLDSNFTGTQNRKSLHRDVEGDGEKHQSSLWAYGWQQAWYIE